MFKNMGIILFCMLIIMPLSGLAEDSEHYNNNITGKYVAAFGSVMFYSNDYNVIAQGDIKNEKNSISIMNNKLDRGFGGSGVIGFLNSNGLFAELELGYLSKEDVDKVNKQNKMIKYDLLVASLNAGFMVPVLSLLNLGVSAGIGLGKLGVEGQIRSDKQDGMDFGQGKFSDLSSYVFSYQARVDLSVDIASNALLGLSYKFITLSDISNIDGSRYKMMKSSYTDGNKNTVLNSMKLDKLEFIAHAVELYLKLMI